jgi:hypothetical protein
VLGERHLRHILLSYLQYYNEVRTHLVVEQGCAGTAPNSERWVHSLPCDLGWIAPPICPDLIYDRHNGQNLFDRYVDYADAWIEDQDFKDPQRFVAGDHCAWR